MVSAHCNHRSLKGQDGFSLIETIIALALLFFALIIGMQFLLVRTGTALLNERQHGAEEAAENALNALAARSGQELPASNGTFNMQPDGTIQITDSCTDSNCDGVFTPGEAGSYASPAGGVIWSRIEKFIASDYELHFVRRWRVDTINQAMGQRKITVVVLPNSNSTRPLAVRSVEATVKSR